MRSSRISHPPGSRFIAVHVWAVHHFGLAGAAILGELDFLDRAQEQPNQPLASRARIIADLEGVVGRNAIDTALSSLEAAGVICRHVLTRLGEKNIERRVSYGLNIDGLANLLGSPQTGSSRLSLNRESPEVPESVPKSGLEPGVPTYICIKEKEAAALHTHSAAAPNFEEKRKSPRRTANGIECWYRAEDAQADEIESNSDPAAITAAVKLIKSRKNSKGKQTSPVPAIVKEELERRQRERAMADQRDQEALNEGLRKAKIAEDSAAKFAKAKTYFESLNKVTQEELLASFKEHISNANTYVFQEFRKKNIGTETVQRALWNFITETVFEATEAA